MIKLTPARSILLFFIAVITIGTLLLLLPISHRNPVRFIDALFTSTSATCVTGLVVLSTPLAWTTFGQIIILLLIQLGGLGYMSFATLMAIIHGRITLKERLILKEILNISTFRELLKVLLKIFAFVLVIEIIGAIFLFVFLPKQESFIKSVYFSFFHSVSAFCNAGFSLFEKNLECIRANIPALFTIMFLIVSGGIGFLVVLELISFNFKALSLHTRAVLMMTTLLILVGMVGFSIFEWFHSLRDLGIGHKLTNALFHSITPRTAGFNTLNVSEMLPSTLFLTMALMLIGGSPGGTAGGIKTTTFLVMLLSILTVLKGKTRVNLYKWNISQDTILRSFVIAFSSLVVIAVLFLMLLVVEKKRFVELLFETFSSFGTVGLSMGITPNLSDIGKLIIILLMFTGRLGPLCLGAAVLFEEKVEIKLPEGKIAVG